MLPTHGYVALTFLSCFAVVAIGLKFFRIDFSSPQFFLGMVIITALVEMFFYVHRHGAPLHIAVVPGATPLAKLPKTLRRSIRFTWLTDVPSEFDYSGVIADFSSELEPEWEHFLALLGSSGHSSVSREAVQRVDHRTSGRRSSVGEHVGRNRPGAHLPAIQARYRLSWAPCCYYPSLS